MRLAAFIEANTDQILREWDSFARSIWPEVKASPVLLRDHAEALLRAAVRDMMTDQSGTEQTGKSKGRGPEGAASDSLDEASKEHASGRVRSGFDLMELVSEYRALRASVLRFWSASSPSADAHDLRDVTRFNESVDQSLSEAVRHFSVHMDNSREMFLGILGHDLRNPLNAMQLSAQAIAETAGGDTARLAAQITASGDAMSRLLSDFIDFTATRLGRGIPISRREVDLGALAQQVVNEFQASHPQRAVRLRLTGNLVGQWDGERLRQVLSNLIGNALQHGAETSPIDVSAEAEGAGAVLRIQNGGEAIPEDALPSIFDPLVQGQPPPPGQRRHGSMGLGLHIARQVVLAHGGTIEVQSTPENGTTFTVRLPRESADQRRTGEER